MIVSKSEFARRRNVTAARVSQWLSEGKIFGAAIVGEGRLAQIDEVVACQQLGERLDTDQRHANGLATNLTPVVGEQLPPSASAPAAPTAASPPSPLDNPLERQLLEHKVIKAERDNREAARDEALANGDLVDTASARRATAKEIAQVIARVEGALPEISSELAAQFKLPQRDVLHAMRGAWRKVRSAGAIEARERAEPLPDRVGYELLEEQ
jgi:hypothetical protein